MVSEATGTLVALVRVRQGRGGGGGGGGGGGEGGRRRRDDFDVHLESKGEGREFFGRERGGGFDGRERLGGGREG